MANKPLTPKSKNNNNILLVDRGGPVVSHKVPIQTLGAPAHVSINGVPAIILSTEVDRISDLKIGRNALVPKTAGFARLDSCLVYRDARGYFHYFYSKGNNDEPTLVEDEWDIGFIWENPPDPNRPDPSAPSVTLVYLKWNLVDPAKPNMPEPFEFPGTLEDAEIFEDAWNL